MAGYIGSKSSGIISGIDASIADLNLTDKAAANGVTEANKVLTADANKDVTAIRNLTATGDVTAGGAITATGTVTRALTRGSIDVGNSSGVSSALAKGAAGTVLTSDGTDLSFVEASGGGEQEFTASGNITAGQLVGIKSDGTVAVMEQAESGIVELGASNAYVREALPIAAASNGSDKVLVVWCNSTDSYKLYAAVGTISGTNISFGTGVAVLSQVDQYDPVVTYDANAGKFLIVWENDDSTYIVRAVVATVSGTSVSFGTVLDVASGMYRPFVLYNSDSQSSVIVYKNSSNSTEIYGRVLTISGTSVSAGSALTIENTSGAKYYLRLSYDTTANKYLVAYSHGSVSKSNAKVLTVSGTSISAGALAVFNTIGTTGLSISYNPVANRHILNYYASSYKIVVGTISGTSVTFGSELPIPVNLYAGSYYDSIAQKTIIIGEGSFTKLQINSFSGNTPTLNPFTFQWGEGSGYSAGAAPNFITISSTLTFWVWKANSRIKTQILNENMHKFVGIAKENISNGATGKVTVAGGINTSMSGLTVGKAYGLAPQNTTISEIDPASSGSTSIFGTALSSTSIYIDKGNLR